MDERPTRNTRSGRFRVAVEHTRLLAVESAALLERSVELRKQSGELLRRAREARQRVPLRDQ